ncbi:MAG: hypothetical protein EB084_13865, partial [Proteobacteria bacterium]|nr:hypothetical protein [Pseudomonadota bacterium]
VEVRNYMRSSYVSNHYSQKVINFDDLVLQSRIRSRLAERVPAARMLIDDRNADCVVRARFVGDEGAITGTFIVVDGQGVVLAEEARKIDMPFFTGDDMTAAAMKRACEIIDKSMVKLAEKLPQPRP